MCTQAAKELTLLNRVIRFMGSSCFQLVLCLTQCLTFLQGWKQHLNPLSQWVHSCKSPSTWFWAIMIIESERPPQLFSSLSLWVKRVWMVCLFWMRLNVVWEQGSNEVKREFTLDRDQIWCLNTNRKWIKCFKGQLHKTSWVYNLSVQICVLMLPLWCDVAFVLCVSASALTLFTMKFLMEK